MKLDIGKLHPSLRPALNALVTANNALNPVVRRPTRDDLLEPNSPSPKRISLGRTFGAGGVEGEQDYSDDETRPLDPDTHFLPDAILHAEPGPTVPSLGFTFKDREAIAAVSKATGMSRDAAAAALSSMRPREARAFVDGARDTLAKADHLAKLTVVGNYAKTAANYAASMAQDDSPAPSSETGTEHRHRHPEFEPVNDYAARMSAEGARRDEAFARAQRISEITSTPVGSTTPVYMGPGYDPISSFNQRNTALRADSDDRVRGTYQKNGTTDRRSAAPVKANRNIVADFKARMDAYAAQKAKAF